MATTAPPAVQPAAETLALVRIGGDIATKGRETRRRFTTRLVRNLKDALRSHAIDARIVRTHDRIRVESSDPRSHEVLARVMGVQSVSPATRHLVDDLDEVVALGQEHFAPAVKGRSFGVRARRVGNRSEIPIRSGDLQRALGAALLPGARAVDLDQPEVEVRVELLPGSTCFFTKVLPGPAGLPIGVEGRAVALVSGGFDSAVAAWQMLKRGVAFDYVFCGLGGRAHQLGALRVMQHVARHWSYGSRPRFHALDFDAISEQLQTRVASRYRQVVLKRIMLRAAECVATETGALATVTGDAMGQVSSQTLPNLAVISEASSLPILRPLVGMNKDEILAIARRIGTFDLSKVVDEYCALVPRRPATAAAREDVLREESRLAPGLLERAVAERCVFDLRALDLEAIALPELWTNSIPEGATVIDLRSRPAFENWHYPDALFLDFAHALQAYPHFSRDDHYVVYCEIGLKSAHLVEQMRREGFAATHFKDGARALRSLAEKPG